MMWTKVSCALWGGWYCLRAEKQMCCEFPQSFWQRCMFSTHKPEYVFLWHVYYICKPRQSWPSQKCDFCNIHPVLMQYLWNKLEAYNLGNIHVKNHGDCHYSNVLKQKLFMGDIMVSLSSAFINSCSNPYSCSCNMKNWESSNDLTKVRLDI